MTRTTDDELTPERLRQIESRWKSDVDLKLDRLVTFMDKNEAFIDLLMIREASSARMREAIIEKSIIALIWGAIGGLGVLIVSGAQTEVSKFAESIRQMKK